MKNAKALYKVRSEKVDFEKKDEYKTVSFYHFDYETFPIPTRWTAIPTHTKMLPLFSSLLLYT